MQKTMSAERFQQYYWTVKQLLTERIARFLYPASCLQAWKKVKSLPGGGKYAVFACLLDQGEVTL